MDPAEPTLICPYNKSHVIISSRMQFHLTKCRQQHPTNQKVLCPFNSTHVIPKVEYDYHLQFCPNRIVLDAFTYKVGSSSAPKVELTKVEPIIITSDENWDICLHIKVCDDRTVLDAFVFRIGNSTAPRVQFTTQPVEITCDEYWDTSDEGTASVLERVQESSKNKPIMNTLIGAPKSERVAFRYQERKRMQNILDNLERLNANNRESLQQERRNANNRESPQQERLNTNNRESPQQERLNANNRESPQQERLNTNNRESPQQERLNANIREPPQQERLNANIREPPQQERLNANNRESPQQERLNANNRESSRKAEVEKGSGSSKGSNDQRDSTATSSFNHSQTRVSNACRGQATDLKNTSSVQSLTKNTVKRDPLNAWGTFNQNDIVRSTQSLQLDDNSDRGPSTSGNVRGEASSVVTASGPVNDVKFNPSTKPINRASPWKLNKVTSPPTGNNSRDNNTEDFPSLPAAGRGRGKGRGS